MLRKTILINKIIWAVLRGKESPLYVRLVNAIVVLLSAWKRSTSELVTSLDYLDALMSGFTVVQYFTTAAPGRHMALPFQGSSWLGMPAKRQVILTKVDIFSRGTDILEISSMPEELKSAPTGTLLCVKDGVLQKTL